MNHIASAGKLAKFMVRNIANEYEGLYSKQGNMRHGGESYICYFHNIHVHDVQWSQKIHKVAFIHESELCCCGHKLLGNSNCCGHTLPLPLRPSVAVFKFRAFRSIVCESHVVGDFRTAKLYRNDYRALYCVYSLKRAAFPRGDLYSDCS